MKKNISGKLYFNKSDIADILGVTLGILRFATQIECPELINWKSRKQNFTDQQVFEIIKKVRKRLTDEEIDQLIRKKANYTL